MPKRVVIVRRPAAVLAGLCLLLAGCSASASNSPSAAPSVSEAAAASATASPTSATSPTASATASASSAATSAPTPPPTPNATATPPPTLARLSLATVTVDALNVRVAASSTAALVTGAGPLSKGDRVLVLAGPTQAGAYAWYEVGVASDPTLYAASQQVGWVADGTSAQPWLVPDTSACPQPSVASISALSFIVRLGCYHDRSLSFGAHQAALAPDAGLGGTCGATPPMPDWLVCDNVNYNWVNGDGGTAWLLLLHFDPATGVTATGLAPAGTTGPALKVAGHFEDPAANACVTASDPQSVDGLSQWLTCAVDFVVESVTAG
jgi:hypothetical protein